MDIIRGTLLGLHLVTLATLVVLAVAVVVRPSARLGTPLRSAGIVLGLSGLALVAALAAADEPLNAAKLAVKLAVLVGVVGVATLVAGRMRDGAPRSRSAPALAGVVIALAATNTGIAYAW